MLKMMKQFEADVDAIAWGTMMSRAYEDKKPLPVTVLKVAVLAEMAWGFLSRVLVCRVFGHKLEGEDWGTPDSGYMGVTCKRCGGHWGGYVY